MTEHIRVDTFFNIACHIQKYICLACGETKIVDKGLRIRAMKKFYEQHRDCKND